MKNLRENFLKQKQAYSDVLVNSFTLMLQALFLVVKSTDNSEESQQIIKEKKTKVFDLLKDSLKVYVNVVIGGSDFGGRIITHYFPYYTCEFEFPREEFEVNWIMFLIYMQFIIFVVMGSCTLHYLSC